MDEQDIPTEYQWMFDCHAKELYTRGPYKTAWDKHQKLPKLHHMDFIGIVSLLTSDLMVEQFRICHISRNNQTGEYYYGNDNDEWMPQSNLMDTRLAAEKERTRILNMLKKWLARAGKK